MIRVLPLLLCLAACADDDDNQGGCSEVNECPEGQRCRMGKCLPPEHLEVGVPPDADLVEDAAPLLEDAGLADAAPPACEPTIQALLPESPSLVVPQSLVSGDRLALAWFQPDPETSTESLYFRCVDARGEGAPAKLVATAPLGTGEDRAYIAKDGEGFVLAWAQQPALVELPEATEDLPHPEDARILHLARVAADCTTLSDRRRFVDFASQVTVPHLIRHEGQWTALWWGGPRQDTRSVFAMSAPTLEALMPPAEPLVFAGGDPAAAVHPEHGILLAFSRWESEETGVDLSVALHTPNLGLGAELQLAPSPFDDRQSGVHADEHGWALVHHAERVEDPLDFDLRFIRLQKTAEGLALRGPEVPLGDAGPGAIDPAAAWSSALQEHAVAWRRTGADGQQALVLSLIPEGAAEVRRSVILATNERPPPQVPRVVWLDDRWVVLWSIDGEGLSLASLSCPPE